LIIVDDDGQCDYIEGCSAPKFNKLSLHAGGVEVYVGKRAKMRYSSVENWSINTYNLNTKRGIVDDDGFLEWVNGNLGSGITMLYPCSILKGDRSRSDQLGVAVAAAGQNQDTGSKVIHIGKDTASTIISKSISKD
jgi:Fe-S cluster assembly protein SufB